MKLTNLTLWQETTLEKGPLPAQSESPWSLLSQ